MTEYYLNLKQMNLLEPFALACVAGGISVAGGIVLLAGLA